MHEIVIPEILYEELPLSDVVDDLIEQVRQNDPDKAGLNFLINSLGDDGASLAAGGLGGGGLGLDGGDGDDILRGGAGNDTLWGGVGQDQLRGGSGSDKYVIQSGEGSNSLSNVSYVVSTEFEKGTDKIFLKTGLSFSDLTITTATGGQANDHDVLSTGDILIFETNGGTKYLLILQNPGSLTIDSSDFEEE